MSTTSAARDADRDGFTEQMLAWFAQGEELAARADGPYVLYEDEVGDRVLASARVRVGGLVLALTVALWFVV